MKNCTAYSLSNLQLFFTVAVLDFSLKLQKKTIHYFDQVSDVTKDSVGAVKAGELLLGQVKLTSEKTQLLQSGSVTTPNTKHKLTGLKRTNKQY